MKEILQYYTEPSLIYLASPYSHPDKKIMRKRYEHALRCTAFIMSNGVLVFSPIVHSHPISEKYNLPCGWDFWERFDTRLISASDQVWVLKLDGWRTSVGVQAEIKIAEKADKPIRYLEQVTGSGNVCYYKLVDPKEDR